MKLKNILMLSILIGATACKKEEVEEEIDPIVSVPTTSLELPDLTSLPFGGQAPTNILIQNQGDPQPALLSLWLCGLPANGAGNSDASDWTNPDGSWNYELKPQVDGNVLWPHQLEMYIDSSNNRIISGNGLPNHPTGIFPITPGSAAYQYDGNPNVISPQNVYYVLPAMPVEASQPSCVPFGPSGISLTGSAIYHGSSTLGNDAAAHEMLDRFGGHTDGTERYHYHYPSDDLMDHIHLHTQGHSPLTGYMLDGFGIYGPYGEQGELLTSADLDECHGHKHPVMWDGQMVDIYHYHWTHDFPYNIGCFKGTP